MVKNINDIFKGDPELTIKEQDQEIIPQSPQNKKEIEQQQAKDQLSQIFKTPQRKSQPTPEELSTIINEYFNTIHYINYGKHTLHAFLGMTDDDITLYILPDDELKSIYNFAIEKLKAKIEVQMNIAGRPTDAFAMQNIAGWRKKDPEEKEEVSGLAELHKTIKTYKSKPKQ